MADHAACAIQAVRAIFVRSRSACAVTCPIAIYIIIFCGQQVGPAWPRVKLVMPTRRLTALTAYYRLDFAAFLTAALAEPCWSLGRFLNSRFR